MDGLVVSFREAAAYLTDALLNANVSREEVDTVVVMLPRHALNALKLEMTPELRYQSVSMFDGARIDGITFKPIPGSR